MKQKKPTASVAITVGKVVLDFNGEHHEFTGGSSHRELRDGKWVDVPDPDLIPLKDAMGEVKKSRRGKGRQR